MLGIVCAQDAEVSFSEPSRRVGAGRAVSQELGSMVVKSIERCVNRGRGSFQSPRVRTSCRARSEHEIVAGIWIMSTWCCNRHPPLAFSIALCICHLLPLMPLLSPAISNRAYLIGRDG
jgi:hypothetical protein